MAYISLPAYNFLLDPGHAASTIGILRFKTASLALGPQIVCKCPSWKIPQLDWSIVSWWLPRESASSCKGPSDRCFRTLGGNMLTFH